MIVNMLLTNSGSELSLFKPLYETLSAAGDKESNMGVKFIVFIKQVLEETLKDKQDIKSLLSLKTIIDIKSFAFEMMDTFEKDYVTSEDSAVIQIFTKNEDQMEKAGFFEH